MRRSLLTAVFAAAVGLVPVIAHADPLNNPNAIESTLTCSGQTVTVIGTLHSASAQVIGSTSVTILEDLTVTSPTGETQTLYQRGQGQMVGVSVTPCTVTVPTSDGNYVYTFYLHMT